jgi:phospholipid N-methyltransferase
MREKVATPWLLAGRFHRSRNCIEEISFRQRRNKLKAEKALNAPTLLFARSFLKNPRMLGSFLPSSRYLTRNLMRHIPRDSACIVEYGPGVGTVTLELLKGLRRDGILIAIEQNPGFVQFLRENVRDRRLHVHEGSAEDVARIVPLFGSHKVDCIVSGIPYSTLAAHTRDNILRNSRLVLREGGTFLVYQFTSAVAPHMREVFGPVHQEIEFRNFLPARIFSARG